jgi:hypothetical protein
LFEPLSARINSVILVIDVTEIGRDIAEGVVIVLIERMLEGGRSINHVTLHCVQNTLKICKNTNIGSADDSEHHYASSNA